MGKRLREQAVGLDGEIIDVTTVEEREPSYAYVCVGNGPSLDYNALQACNVPGVRVIAINDVFQWAPWAYALYGADYRWWRARHPDLVRSNFRGRKLSLDEAAVADFRLEFVSCEDLHKPMPGLAPLGSDAIRHGYSSGFQALQLARLWGAKRIALLGYDYGASGQGHAAVAAYAYANSDFPTMVTAFNNAAAQLSEEGIEVTNCTPTSALTCFPRGDIHEWLDSAAR